VRSRLALIVVFSMLAVILASSQTSPSPARDLYEKGMNAIRGGPLNRNPLAAVDDFRKSAGLGYVPAQDVLGYFYEKGITIAADSRRAADWYKKAAEQGDPLGTWLYGRLIYQGLVPPQSLNDAIPWLQRAPGDPFAQQLLGLIKLQKNEYARAAELFRQASEQGLPQAQYELGLLLQQGPSGVPRDRFEAYVWLLMAADAGIVYPDLQSLESDLGANRTEEAKTTARRREHQYSRSVLARGCTAWEGEFDRIPQPPPPDIQPFCH
jgi:TPR repeat protein